MKFAARTSLQYMLLCQLTLAETFAATCKSKGGAAVEPISTTGLLQQRVREGAHMQKIDNCTEVTMTTPEVWIHTGKPITITGRTEGTCFNRSEGWTADPATLSVWDSAVPCTISQIRPQRANNNMAIWQSEEGRLYLAWRTAPTHFASRSTEIWCISKPSWNDDSNVSFEFRVSVHNDLREPLFFWDGSTLKFTMFEAQAPETDFDPLFGAGVSGSSAGIGKLLKNGPPSFQPKSVWETEMVSPGRWSNVIQKGGSGEVVWAFGPVPQTGTNYIYKSGYVAMGGDRYTFTAEEFSGESFVDVFLNRTLDGVTWQNATPADAGWNSIKNKDAEEASDRQGNDILPSGVVYRGGTSEMGFGIHPVSGDYFGVLRNDEGDPNSRFGSRVLHFNQTTLKWTPYPQLESDPYIYMSPQVFATDADLFLVARRNIDKPFDSTRDSSSESLPFKAQHTINEAVNSFTQGHTTTLMLIDADSKKLKRIVDIGGCGDTGFPQILKLHDGRYLVINYSNGFDENGKYDEGCKEWPWIRGQADGGDGTQIYIVIVDFTSKATCSCSNEVSYCAKSGVR